MVSVDSCSGCRRREEMAFRIVTCISTSRLVSRWFQHVGHSSEGL